MRPWLLYLFIFELTIVGIGVVVDRNTGAPSGVTIASHATPEVQRAELGIPVPPLR